MKKTSSHKASVRKKQRSKKSVPSPKPPEPGNSTKQAQLISLLKQPSGVTLPDLMKATGWQAHSIRGFISGTLKKRLSLKVISGTTSTGLRRYRISEVA
jgi:Protein of unknown function (DUF3489)